MGATVSSIETSVESKAQANEKNESSEKPEVPDRNLRIGVQCHYRYRMAILRQINMPKWREMINFLVQLHYDSRPRLSPDTISLAAEYLAIAVDAGNLDLESVGDVRQSYDVRIALFEAAKRGEGYYMMMQNKLWDMNHYDDPLVFSNDEAAYQRLIDQENIPSAAANSEKQINRDILKLILNKKRVEFCDKIDCKFPEYSRFKLLMVYLKRMGFDTESVISMNYMRVKKEYRRLNDNQSEGTAFSDEVLFCFLCRYLLEMTYYQPMFYAPEYVATPNELIVSIIYSALLLAQRWREKFNFNRILQAMNGKEQCSWKDLQSMLDGKHPKNDHELFWHIPNIIRIARMPHHCFNNCTPIYHLDPVTGTNTHYHRCKCLYNCCLNTYLKYGKTAFGEVSKIPLLWTSSIERVVDAFADRDIAADPVLMPES